MRIRQGAWTQCRRDGKCSERSAVGRGRSPGMRGSGSGWLRNFSRFASPWPHRYYEQGDDRKSKYRPPPLSAHLIIFHPCRYLAGTDLLVDSNPKALVSNMKSRRHVGAWWVHLAVVQELV